jgi:Polyketide cyclase / dehydrase and lipid transport.
VKAERIQRTASFIVNTSIEKAFPLFGPVREKEWATGWEPEIIYSSHPEVEEHMIFKTKATTKEEDFYLWTLTQYRPKEYLVAYTVSTSLRIWFITVACADQNQNTKVTVTYSYTGLTEEGNRLNKLAIEKMYAQNLKDWEEAINYYLKTGKQLE